ncbi:hypothetical protein WJX72_009927 [[Myrmecia] bisecta]|uniref:PPIase cyclophilin-type domain-containing protein n=1 Tax=[Myrmecia] bisecta TaxID=41462 RepID=A0AAW1R8L3_9CHLO
MTRFVGDSLAVRAGRKKGGITSKQMKKEMEEYLATGVHAALAEASTSRSQQVAALPDKDVRRPFVFFDIKVGRKILGRLVIEIFEDMLPVTARHFANRCRHGATDTFQGTALHYIVPGLAAYGGLSKGYKGAGVEIKRSNRLRHAQRGAVSISESGSEFAIAFGRSLTLDSTHQVIGRVNIGDDVLTQLEALETDKDDCPLERVSIAASGTTNPEGTHESLDEAQAAAARRRETPEQAAARLKQESAQARGALQEALATGLQQPRKPDAGPPDKGKRGMLDAMLGDLSGSDVSSSDEEED